MNMRLLPLILKPLLKRPGLARAKGPEGHLRKQGVFPDRLVVRFNVPTVETTGVEPPIAHFS
jgi:hypothetical protein